MSDEEPTNVLQAITITKELDVALQELAAKRGVAVSALMVQLLERPEFNSVPAQAAAASPKG
jgi:hypothetical protein